MGQLIETGCKAQSQREELGWKEGEEGGGEECGNDKETPASDDNPLVRRLAQERERLREETEAKDKQEEEERQLMEEMRKKEEEEKRQQAIEKRRKAKEVSEAKSRQLQREIAET